jgi:hypothetical protein
MMKLQVLLIAAAAAVGCATTHDQPAFEMEVHGVVELNGFVMKGISFTGAVARGCLANDDDFVVQRNGIDVMNSVARIVNVENLSSAEAFNGKIYTDENATLFIPDGKKGDVQPGDKVTSRSTSCENDRRP